jgi:hypothetical protein
MTKTKAIEETNKIKEPETIKESNFIEKNFNYINLALFVGLYIACFVYLLKDDTKTISAMIFICIYHFFFLFFISKLISNKRNDSMNWITIISWCSIFISTIFQLISIIIIIIIYKFLVDKYISKNIDLPFNDLLKKELNDYNILFVSITSITIVFIGFLLYNDAFISNQITFFFQPYYYPVIICIFSVAILSISSELIKISNDFLEFKNKSVISIPVYPSEQTNEDSTLTTP